MKGNCEICDKEIEIYMCCSGYECGCMGQPTESPVCSEGCYEQWILNSSNESLKRQLRERKLTKIGL